MNYYEEFVKTTDISNHSPIFYIFGMLEEAGEIAGVCKRAMRGDYGEDVKHFAETGFWKRVFEYQKVREDLIKEKGDQHWYSTRMLQELGITLEDVRMTNYTKLKERKNNNKIMGKGDNR